MLLDVRNRVRRELAAGKSREEVIAIRPTAAHDARWGGGFIKPDAFVDIVCRSLARGQ